MNAELGKSELSTFERFLYWFFIPIVFTIVCTLVFLSLFNYDVKNEMLKVAHKIPLVGSLVPEPQTTPAPTGSDKQDTFDKKAFEQQAADFNKKLADKDAQLKQADTTFQQKDQTIKDLQAKLAAAEEQLKTKTKTDDEYRAQVQQTATMFAGMNPSKAAPIMENFTLMERVLILSEMKPDDRVKVLEKMDPKKAAEAAIYLKDVVPAKDREIAALQERAKQVEDTNSAQKVSKADIGQTFANMTPKSAAQIVLDMEAINPTKVNEILSSMTSQARSSLLAAMADLSKDGAAAAAKISARLIQ